MTVLFEIAGLLLVFDDSDLLGAGDLGDCGGNTSLFYIWRADSSVLAIIDEQHLVKDDFVAFCVLLAFYCSKLFNANKIAL